MSFGKTEGDAFNQNIAFMLQKNEANGPYYHQEWQGMPQTKPIISGGMKALRLPAFFENGPLECHIDCWRYCLRPQGWTQTWRHPLR